MSQGTHTSPQGADLETLLERRAPAADVPLRVAPVPLLEALKLAGTTHVYADTADEEELAPLALTDRAELVSEIDGNTINQPLVHKVLARELDGPLAVWLRRARARLSLGDDEFAPLAYAAANVRLGHAIVRRFARGRSWDASLQLHMDVAADTRRALELGGWMRRALPQTLTKVPFQPQNPRTILTARDLERAGIPVNFTSTFSARQVAVAALLAGVTRANVFMGRIDAGLSARMLGEHVALEAQRLLLPLRGELGLPTRLIVASIRDWRSIARVAGCDAFTVPAEVLRDFLEQEELAPDEIESHLETSYEHELGLADETVAALPAERIARLYQVEPELIEFLRAYRSSREFAGLADGEPLRERFVEAGFGDLFHDPSDAEQRVLDAGKLPDLASDLPRRIALDTLFTLHADADFRRHQRQMDEDLLAASGRGG